MPLRRPARPTRRLRECRSNLRRKRNRAWLQANVVEKILGVAALIERKRAQEQADDAAGPVSWRSPPGPASREAPCDAAANTPSMPR